MPVGDAAAWPVRTMVAMTTDPSRAPVTADQCWMATWDWSWRPREQTMRYVERTAELPSDELAGLIVALGADVVGADVANLFERP